MATIKRQLWSHLEQPLQPALQESVRLMEASLQSDDFREGVASYLEQRTPKFSPL
jgi:enoyl-CoA hydratase/carnithine racemase